VLTLEADLLANSQPSWPFVAYGRKADVASASFWGSTGQPGSDLDGLLQITSPNSGYVNVGSLLGAPGAHPPHPVASHGAAPCTAAPHSAFHAAHS
jgi:hypothetical protein